MNLLLLLTLSVLLIVPCSEAYKILVIFNFPIKSLSHLGSGFVRHLLKAGHEVTYVTPYPANKPVKNLREIDVGKSVLHLLEDELMDVTPVLNNEKQTADILDVQGLMETAIAIYNATFQDPNFMKLLRDPSEEFDAIIVELYELDIYNGLSVLYNSPIIYSHSMFTQWSVLKRIDEASNPAYTVDNLSKNVPPLTFAQRLEELWYQIKGKYVKELVIRPQEEVLYKNVFEPLLATRGRTLPPLDKVAYNASLVFVNEFNAWGNIPSTPQNLILVGGQHIEVPVKPLNQTIMDTAEHGVIYFSLGTMFDPTTIPISLKRALVKMFGELKQTVIWKYDGEDLVDLPKNLFVLKWAPQTSILNHPKCVLFITHGGLLSSIETVHFGVPTISVPIFFDQSVNSARAAANGYSITIHWSYNLAQDFKQAILEILQDKRYASKVKQISQIYHDRLAPLDKEVVYWVEHVIRSRGALHLRSPGLQLCWYQKMYLDFVGLVLAVLLVVIFTIRYVLCLASKKTTAQKKEKLKNN